MKRRVSGQMRARVGRFNLKFGIPLSSYPFLLSLIQISPMTSNGHTDDPYLNKLLVEIKNGTQVIDASRASFLDSQLETLMHALVETHSAKELNLSDHFDCYRDEFPDDAGDILVETVSKYLARTGIEKLVLTELELTDRGVAALSKVLKDSKIKVLNLGENEITGKGVKFLADGILGSSVEKLLLYENKIGNEGAIHLARSLSSGACNLKFLHLSNCGLGSEGTEAIAKSLALSTLENISLLSNPIGSIGSLALAHGLPGSILKSLSTALTDEGLAAIAENLLASKLESLQTTMRFSDASILAMAKAIPSSQLKKFHFIATHISDNTGVILAEAVKSSSLQSLSLTHAPLMCDRAPNAFLAAARESSSLIEFYYPFKSDGWKEIKDSIDSVIQERRLAQGLEALEFT